MKKILIFLTISMFLTMDLTSQITTPTDPKLVVETQLDGQVAIRGHSAPIGTVTLPPDDPGSIGVLGVGFSGVKGEAKAEFGNGVWGITAKDNSNGVLGQATAGSFSYGVRGEAMGASASAGVYGRYTGSSIGYGVHGAAIGTNVRGVFGVVSNGSTGHAGYFTGGSGVYVSPRLGVQNLDPQYPIHVGTGTSNGNGAHVTGGGTWTNGSSRSFKEDFVAVDNDDILRKISDLGINRWKYKDSDEGEHLGPVAEDFYAAFGLGDDNRYISTIDADGVALTAIQALHKKAIEQQRETTRLIAKIDNQEKLINNLVDIAKTKRNRKKRIKSLHKLK